MNAARRRLAGPLGAGLLLISLVLSWSHQIPAAEHARFRGPALFGVARDPTALQVYAIAGELLGALALWGAVAGRRPGGRGRAAALAATLVAAIFVLHAIARPPTNGLLLAGAHAAGRYVPDPAGAGPGETLALFGLGLMGLGLAGGLRRP